ncbi:MAG: hypothetical protein ACLFQE_06940 [Thermotogota bacterium]
MDIGKIIENLVDKPLKDFPFVQNAKWFESDAIEEIVLFSDGNPRDALRMSQKAVLENMEFLPNAKHFKVNVFLVSNV